MINPLTSFGGRATVVVVAAVIAGASATVAVDARDDGKAPAKTESTPIPSTSKPVVASPVQNHDLTPGQYYSGINLQELCATTGGNTISDIPLAEAKQAFAEYKIPYPQGDDLMAWAIDHVVPLSLGGTNDITNLWPMKIPKSTEKDTLEARMHDLVCAGSLDLVAAQQAIGYDWEGQYLKYFGRRP